MHICGIRILTSSSNMLMLLMLDWIFFTQLLHATWNRNTKTLPILIPGNLTNFRWEKWLMIFSRMLMDLTCSGRDILHHVLPLNDMSVKVILFWTNVKGIAYKIAYFVTFFNLEIFKSSYKGKYYVGWCWNRSSCPYGTSICRVATSRCCKRNRTTTGCVWLCWKIITWTRLMLFCHQECI